MSRGDSDGDFSFLLGLSGGFFVGVFTVATFLSLGSPASVANVLSALREWQTLVAGLIALLGALLTVVVIEKQLALARETEDDRRKRKHYAARAGMPAALSELVDYSRQSYAVFKLVAPPGNFAGARILHDAPWVSPRIPGIPSSALRVMTTCIESAPTNIMPDIANLVEEFQVLHARMLSLVQDVSPGSTMIVTWHNLHDQISDMLEYELSCQNMFDYARRRSERVSSLITRQSMHTRAFFENFHAEDYPGLAELIDRRFPDGEAQA